MSDASNFIFNTPQDWYAHYPQGKSVVVNGDVRHMSATPKPEGHDTRAYSKPFSDVFKTIQKSDWSAAIKEQNDRQRCSSDYCDFAPFDQNGKSSCWGNGSVQALVTQRRIQGLPLVMLSTCSVTCPITGGSDRGGYEGEAVKYLQQNGASRVELWPPNAYDFSYDTPESKADRENHKVLGVCEMQTEEDWVTAAIMNYVGPFAYDWMSHVMMACDVVEIEPGSFGWRPRNSWGDWGQQNRLGKYGWSVYRFPHGRPSSGFIYYQGTASTK